MKTSRIILFSLGLIPLLGIAQTTDTLKPVYKFESTVHDFGKISEGPQVTAEFTCTNIGKTPLTITNVSVSCSCMSPDWSKEPIPPGKTGQIKITYNSTGRPGHFTKVTRVEFANGDVENLIIKGFVKFSSTPSPPIMTPSD